MMPAEGMRVCALAGCAPAIKAAASAIKARI
jgi:hypothetical protein